MKGMKNNKNRKREQSRPRACREMTERKKRKERERLCVIVLLLYGRHTLQTLEGRKEGSRPPPSHDAQVNGDSVHSPGLPDCPLGKDCAHWMDLIFRRQQSFIQVTESRKHSPKEPGPPGPAGIVWTTLKSTDSK